MEKRLLREHKRATKLLPGVPAFRPLKRKKLPRPFDRSGGPRVSSTELLPLGQGYEVLFIQRDGPLLTDSAFYGYLLKVTAAADREPLFEFHWHPSHKGFHCMLPCGQDVDFTNRRLSSTPELNMRTSPLDPRRPHDRVQLVRLFCNACGIKIVDPNGDPAQCELEYGPGSW